MKRPLKDKLLEVELRALAFVVITYVPTRERNRTYFANLR